MCGISGFVGRGERSDLERMTRALEHRGPDGEGLWGDPEMGTWLGHRRLSVIDPTTGHQPMWTLGEGLGVVFNGEIYNHVELREELESAGHVFQSDHSDTEVLLLGYRQWGTALVERLNGMWAFAILDRARGELFLSRDRFGQKPLYYSHQGGTFAFASELTALTRHSRLAAEVSIPAVQKYFAYGYIPAPHSLYRGIYKLPAGHNLRVSTRDLKPRVERFWSFELEPHPDPAALDENEVCEALREKLGRAVRRRLMSDVPLGVFLSGGIDSSALTLLAAEAKPTEKLKTFSIGFDEGSFDERHYASRMADFVSSEHECTTLSLERARGLLPSLAGRLDEPMGDPSLLPTSLLCEMARRHVTVAIGGDGADELFAGYDPFRALRAADLYSKLVPRPVHAGIRLLASRLPTSHQNMSLDFKIKRTLAGLDHPAALWNATWMAPLQPTELSAFLSMPVNEEEVYSEAIDAWDACEGGSLVDRTTQFFVRLYMQDGILTKVDRASMLHSLEVRSPFLDIELVDYVRRLPASFKLRGGTTKYILKKAFAGSLPGDITGRGKKGFGVPLGEWFARGELAFGERSSLESIVPGTRSYLHSKEREHRSGRADHRLYLYNHWLLDAHLAAREAEASA
jgi:asparagine synthase (glutamine-hydrolysing)